MKIGTKRAKRKALLLAEGFLPSESQQLSKLPKSTPALRLLRKERQALRERFSRKADRMDWSKTRTNKEYRKRIKNLYDRRGWLVQEGPKGKQRGPRKDKPSLWTMYREYERRRPGKPYVSPWEKKQIKKGKTKLDRGQIFIKKAERAQSSVELENWVAQLDMSIEAATGERKKQLEKQRERLVNKLRRTL